MAGGRDAPRRLSRHRRSCSASTPTWPGWFRPRSTSAIQTGGPPPSDLSDDERRASEQLGFLYQHVAYALMMGSRPQTLYGLADSPVGLAAFMLDHDAGEPTS